MKWYQSAIFYEIYVRAFKDSNADGMGDLQGLTQKLDYISSLGIDCIWLQPIYPSPLVDDGYDIADYYGILPEYGMLEDFKALIEEAHKRNIRVVADLVLNHTSDQHPWFQAARSSRASPMRDYYVWSDTDQLYQEARIIFLDTQKSNWTWDPLTEQFYWHRFYPQQPDLNYDNPQVRKAMMDVMRYWLDIGIDGFRADAVPYLFERSGTNCENLPETHIYLKEMRRTLDAEYTDRILLAEANQWPQDVRPYFGDGDEFNMAFHFPVMPRIYMALAQQDYHPIVDIMLATPPIPQDCQWCTFLRNHDELTLEMVTPEEREFMWNTYAPEPRMRLNLGIRRRLAPLLGGDHRKIELLDSILFTLPGSPIIYYGDEIGMGDDIWLHDRNGVRTPMQWSDQPNAGFSDAPSSKLYSQPISEGPYSYHQVNVEQQVADPTSLWSIVHRMIVARKKYALLAIGDIQFITHDRAQILAFWRSFESQRMLIIHNLSGVASQFSFDLDSLSTCSFRDAFSGEEIEIRPGDLFQTELGPYQYRWLECQAAAKQ